jgi:chromatin remodeling complex protein RSC6
MPVKKTTRAKAKKKTRKPARKAAKKPVRKTAKKRTVRKTAKRTTRTTTRAKAKPKAKAKRKTKAKRKPNPAFMRPMQPDDALAAVVGNKPIPRTEITKKIWGYIKRHGLQDAKNRRMINADDKLKYVFGRKKQVSMFEMTKLISKHIS